MPSSYGIAGYAYKADMYCSGCIVAEVLKDYTQVQSWRLDYISTERDLGRIARYLGINYRAEHTYDSDNFPKVEFVDSALENESVCCVCHEPLVEA